MDSIKNILLDTIENAELVLVGIGEEFEVSTEKMYEIQEFKSILHQMENEKELCWLMPYLEKIYLEKYTEEKTRKAYAALENILKDKNFFIISSCIDDYVYHTKLKKQRIVTPCGGYRKLQCSKGCNNELYEVDQHLLADINKCLAEGAGVEQIKEPKCPSCGQGLVFNNIKAETYAEEDYLEQWNHYTRWIQGTINKKLCVLELGVGMRYPSVIRWPFEKIVYFNQKSCIFRIHSKLYQLTEEIKDRGYKIEEKPVDFLINRFV